MSLRYHHAIPCRRVAAAPSITVAPPCPLPSSHHRAVYRRLSPLCSWSIAVTLTLFLIAKEPLCHPSLPMSHRAVYYYYRRGAVAPSLAVEEPLHRPLPSVTPSLTVKEPSAVSTGRPHNSLRRHLHPSLVTSLPGLSFGWLLGCLSSRGRLPSASASHCGIASRASCPAGCCVSSLLTPPPPICRRLCLSSRHCLVSCPSRASHPAG